MEPDEIEEQEELGEQVADETAPAEKAKPEPAKDAAKDSDRELREEVKALRGRVSEAENNAKYWHGKAAQAPVKEEKADEPDPALSSDLVDAISSGDKKLVQKLFKEMGFVSSKDVDKAISTTRAQITEEAKLYGAFPELQDNKSELFQLTAAKYNELASDPILAKSGKLIEIAAKLAAAELGTEKAKPANRRAAADEEETDRVRRVSTQTVPRGSKVARDATNDDLSAAQSNLVKKFQAAGSTITEEGYKKHASLGVRMSGPGRRAA
jgi:hypothetical protein